MNAATKRISLRQPGTWSQWNVRTLIATLVVLVAVLFTPGMGSAQQTQGTILGTVKDAKGAVVPGATVTLTNTNLNTVRTATSNASGDYHFADVVAGSYTLSVEAAGFQKYNVTSIVLAVRQELRIDTALAIGAVQESVEVTGATLPVIETDSPTIGGGYSTDLAMNLPINSRASFGGTSPSNMVGTLPGNINGFLNGPQGGNTDTTVDGVTLNFSDSTNGWPSSEAISELRADSVLPNAEYGDVGQVIATTKGGTNHFHGSLFWYYQSSAFNAIAWNNPRTVVKPNQIGNTFGGSAGGPVSIPHIYHGRNKSFFFFDWEGWRHPAKSTSNALMPSTLMKQGDFTDYVSTDLPEDWSIINPVTGANYGKKIPSTAISPISANILKTFYPDPNVGDPTAFSFGQAANWTKNVDNSGHSNQYDVRGDQYIGSNQKFLVWGRYTWKSNGSSTMPTGGWNLPYSTNATLNRNLKIDTNWSITPSIINEGSYSFSRNHNGAVNPFDGKAWTSNAGWTGLQNLWQNSLPSLSPGAGTASMGTRLNGPGAGTTNIVADTLIWNHKTHTMKFGFQWENFESVSELSFFGTDQFGNYSFTTSGDHGLVNPIDFADFLMGTPYATSYDVVLYDNDGVTKHFYAFGQDEWRVTPKLTLTYGVRYELQPGYYDKGGDIGNFRDDLPGNNAGVVYMKGWDKILSQSYLASANACNPDGINTTNSATVHGAACMPVLDNEQAGLPIGLRQHPNLRFEPRFGFAYRPFANDNWVTRGGFGIYNETMGSGSFYSLTGTIQAGTVQYANTYTGTPGAGSLGWQWPQVYAGAGAGGCYTCYGQDYFGTANSIKWKDPYVEDWALSLEHDLGQGFGVRLSYIGSESHQLVWAPDDNAVPFSSTRSAYNADWTERLYPNWGVVNTRKVGADASYHSGQLAVWHHLRNGLEVNSEFTYGRSLADNQGACAGQCDGGQNSGSRSTTIYSARYDFGNSGGNPRFYWNSTFLYDLPVGRSRHFGGGMNRIADALVGGWRLAGIFTTRSGQFQTPYIPGGEADPSGTGSGLSSSLQGWNPTGRSQYPDVVVGTSAYPKNKTRDVWLNANHYACPGDPSWTPGINCYTGYGLNADGTPRKTGPGAEHPLPIGRFGTSGVGSVPGPGFVNMNAGLSKFFQIHEKIGFRFEGTFTNVFNHVNLNNPNMNVTSSTFGKITSSVNATASSSPARTGQVSARFEF